MRTIPAFGLALFLLAACGGAPPPSTDRLVSAEASIKSADQLGVGGNPQAVLRLHLAQEELAKAKQFIADSNNEAADRMLSRAQIDGDLALALAREATAVAEAQQALDQIQKLKK